MKQALMSETENKRNKNYLVHTEMIKHMISATIWQMTFCTVLDSKIKIREIMGFTESKYDRRCLQRLPSACETSLFSFF